MSVPSILRVLQAVPAASRLIMEAQRAAQGDQVAIEYIRQQGWADGLDILHPGSGELAQKALEHGREAASAVRELVTGRPGDYIDAEFRELPSPPWEPFVQRLIRMQYGGHIVLGPVGSGKTSLALRLAQRVREAHGYRVELVNVYGEDKPPWAVSIDTDTLVNRMVRLGRWLSAQSIADEDEDLDVDIDDLVDLSNRSGPARKPPTRRVIVIDEASLGLSSSPQDPARRSALQALAQCRHLNWWVIYIAQWAGQLPLPLFGQSTVWVKRPSGDEDKTDRDNPKVRDLWRAAGEAFRGLHGGGWYVDPWKDWRAWAYCDCPSLGAQAGYRGLVPFGMPTDDLDEEEDEV